MRRTIRAAVAGMMALALVGWASAASSHPSGPRAVDQTEACGERVPASMAPEILAGSGETIALDVLVLVDGIGRASAERIVALASGSYAPLDIELVATFKNVRFTPGAASTTAPEVEATALIHKAKNLLGGTRPAGIDIVYVLTAADLVGPNGTSIAGYADCTGGVKYPTRAFATGEGVREARTIGPFNFLVDDAGRIMAHEVGHLLGGHHDHANCVQGIQLTDVTTSQPTPCTLMTPYTELMSSNFGSLESVVVRGHAEDFARP